jgi:hypothetical protein
MPDVDAAFTGREDLNLEHHRGLEAVQGRDDGLRLPVAIRTVIVQPGGAGTAESGAAAPSSQHFHPERCTAHVVQRLRRCHSRRAAAKLISTSTKRSRELVQLSGRIVLGS